MKKKIVMSLLTAAMILGTLTGCGSASAQVENGAVVNAAETEKSASEAAVQDTSEAAGSGSTGAIEGEELEVHIGDQPSFFILKIADEKGYFDEEFDDPSEDDDDGYDGEDADDDAEDLEFDNDEHFDYPPQDAVIPFPISNRFD